VKSISREYEKYIRFYLDSVIIPSEKKLNRTLYYSNPSKPFMAHIKQGADDDNYLFSTPMAVNWNLTSSCNFRCVHCLYNNTEYSNANDLSAKEAMALTEELINDFGVTFVILTGGEIFMRKDTMDIIRTLKRNNVAVRLLTNAALLNDEIIDELSEIFNPYVDSIHISLDGAKSETYEKIRGTKFFDKIVHNIKKLTDKNVKVLTVCTVNKINYDEVVDIYKLSVDLGVYSFISGNMIIHNPGHEKLMVPNNDLFKLFYKLSQAESPETVLSAKFFSQSELINISEVQTILEEPKYQKLLQKYYKNILPRTCQHNEKIAIQADGTIYLCLEALAHNVAPLGNYRDNSLLEIWENRFDNILFQPRRIEDMVCNGCKYNVFCNGGCPVKAYIRTKNLNTPQIDCKMYV